MPVWIVLALLVQAPTREIEDAEGIHPVAFLALIDEWGRLERRGDDFWARMKGESFPVELYRGGRCQQEVGRMTCSSAQYDSDRQAEGTLAMLRRRMEREFFAPRAIFRVRGKVRPVAGGHEVRGRGHVLRVTTGIEDRRVVVRVAEVGP